MNRLKFRPGASSSAGTWNACTVVGSLAYGATNVGLTIVDISDPSRPVLLGSYVLPSSARDVEIVGDLAYVAGYSSGLQILNIAGSPERHATLAVMTRLVVLMTSRSSAT